MLLFELFSIGKRKTEQSNWHIFNEYRNWSEINQSNCTIHGRKLARSSHAVINVGNIHKAFGWFSESIHPRRPRGGQLGREKRCHNSFQVQAEKPLGTDSHWTISKRSSECWLLIGHKKCFVLWCPIGEQYLLSSFREFVHDALLGVCMWNTMWKTCEKCPVFTLISHVFHTFFTHFSHAFHTHISHACEILHSTAIDSIKACLAHAPKKLTQSGLFQFDINATFQNTGSLYIKSSFVQIAKFFRRS